VQMAIFDLAGREVTRLVSGAIGPGVHDAVWGGSDADGRRAAPGIYFARLSLGGRTPAVRRIVLLR